MIEDRTPSAIVTRPCDLSLSLYDYPLRRGAPLRRLALVCFALLAAATAITTTSAASDEFAVVRTDRGLVRGVRHRLRDTDLGSVTVVDEYLGIPYARPPVGELRFAAPDENVPSWSGVRAADTRPHACWQPIDTAFGDFRGSTMWNADTEMSEDCLYLNVWAPAAMRTDSAAPASGSDRSSNSSTPTPPSEQKPLPVMVWIHGGGFFSGSSALDLYDGKRLAAAGRAVVVAVNYRLGVLGFLALPDSAVQGNAGLLDQAAAFGWVRRNAAAFGGDPDSVTLFGASAGAASVAYHLMSPISAPLFHRAILQTGTSLNGWALMTHETLAQRNSDLLVELSCSVPTPGRSDGSAAADSVSSASSAAAASILKCLRRVDPSTILVKQSELRPYVPIVDGVFLPESPRTALAAGRFKRCPVLVGSNADEGSQVLAYMEFESSFNSSSLAVAVNGTALRESLSRILSWYMPPSLVWDEAKLEAVVRRYRAGRDPPGLPRPARSCEDRNRQDYGKDGDDDDDSERNVRVLIDAVSDVVYTCAIADWARLHANAAGATTYRYLFAHVSSQKPWGNWTGAMHGDETPYVFGEPLREPSAYTAAERQLSRHVIALWTGFARTGNPVSDLSAFRHSWPAYSSTMEWVYELSLASLNGSVILDGQRENHCIFWNECFGQWIDNSDNGAVRSSQESISLSSRSIGSSKMVSISVLCFAVASAAKQPSRISIPHLFYAFY